MSTIFLKEKKYFRARISDKKGFPKKYMGNPPSLLTKSGRANPEGISYLYLANNIETTLFEVRAGLKDFCIGRNIQTKREYYSCQS